MLVQCQVILPHGTVLMHVVVLQVCQIFFEHLLAQFIGLVSLLVGSEVLLLVLSLLITLPLLLLFHLFVVLFGLVLV